MLYIIVLLFIGIVAADTVCHTAAVGSGMARAQGAVIVAAAAAAPLVKHRA